jgi:hypothetical protein
MPFVGCHIIFDQRLVAWSRKTCRSSRHPGEVARFAPALSNVGYLWPLEMGVVKYGLAVGRLVCLSSVCSSTLQD